MYMDLVIREVAKTQEHHNYCGICRYVTYGHMLVTQTAASEGELAGIMNVGQVAFNKYHIGERA